MRIRIHSMFGGMFYATFLAITSLGIASTSLAQLTDLVEAKKWDAVSDLIRNGCNVNEQQADGTTALHWAVFHNHEPTVKALLKAGTDPNVATIYSVTPLSLAAERGFANQVTTLLEAGADVESKRLGKETPLMLAARHGDTETLTSLLEHGAKVNARETKGQTALMWAAAAGNTEAVELLIRHNANLDYRLSYSNFSAFHFACRNGRTDTAMKMLELGMDVQATVQPKRTSGRNARNNMSGLMLAIESGHLELALKLIDAGADPNDQRSGFAPLHAVSWVRKTKRGDDPDGDPAPRITGDYTSEQFVRELVAKGANVNLRLEQGSAGKAKLNPKGATPFLLASATADVPLMKLLLELGANPTITNADKCNALMAAAGVGVTAVGEEPGTEEEVRAAVQLLDQLGVDVNHVDNNGETAMHGAAYRNFPTVVTLLSNLGAEPQVWNQNNKHGWTPRLIATGKRPGSVKPSPATIAAIDQALAKEK